MNKILTILITVLTALNLQAADVDSLFTRWESLTGSRRVRTGNELLELGYRDGIIPEKYTYGRSQAIESEARIYDMMSCWYFANDKFDEALSVALMALPLCEKSMTRLCLATVSTISVSSTSARECSVRP
ncbi:unknown [Bacteroides sp. CAG:545]|nr:unknown [Bacteroides sp. CAG:545]